MGKFKRQAGQKPVVEHASNENVKPGNIVRQIVDKLKHDGEEERLCGCSLLSGVVGDAGAAKQLVSAGAIPALCSLVAQPTIQTAALIALRNLSSEDGECCESMVKQDVMSTIFPLISQSGGSDVILHAAHILWNLCEGSDSAITVMTQPGVVKSILPWMDASSTAGSEAAVVVGQCLYTVSEDNIEFCRQIQDSTDMSNFLHCIMEQPPTATSSTQCLLRVLASGILLNVSNVSDTMSESLVQGVMCVLRDVLCLDLSTTVTDLSKAVLNMKGNCKKAHEDMHCESIDKSSPLSELVHSEVKDMRVTELSCSLTNFLTAQQVALEMLTNLSCPGGQDGGEWEDVADGEGMEDGEEEMMEDGGGLMDDEGSSHSQTQIHTLITQHDLFKRVLQCVEGWQGDVLRNLAECSDGRNVVQKMGSLRERALFCLGNLVNNTNSQGSCDAEHLQTVWKSLEKLIVQCSSQTQVDSASCQAGQQDILEPATSALRAVTQRLANIKPEAFSGIDSADLQFLVSMSSAISTPDILVNVINTLAIIGQAVSKQPPVVSIVKDIAVFLVVAAQREVSVWVKAEAVDGLIDVFSEDHMDGLMQELALLVKLRELSKTLQTLAKQQKASLGPHLPVVMTARSNLTRFIKYKSNR